MPSLRDRIKMSEQELRDFLDSAHTLQVASIGEDGRPHLVPMWFAVDAEGDVVFTTYRSSQKIRNIERDPRVTLLVEDGTVYDELRGAMIEGEAELVDDDDATREVMRLVGAKYYGKTPRGPGGAGDSSAGGASTRPDRRRAVPKRIAVRVRPSEVASWDHRKLLEG